uniref:Putative secreted protein n=1 Tax=Anopheles darlingi TaxID=43151 RepID=A0A2M4DID7_ANODA
MLLLMLMGLLVLLPPPPPLPITLRLMLRYGMMHQACYRYVSPAHRRRLLCRVLRTNTQQLPQQLAAFLHSKKRGVILRSQGRVFRVVHVAAVWLNFHPGSNAFALLH